MRVAMRGLASQPTHPLLGVHLGLRPVVRLVSLLVFLMPSTRVWTSQSLFRVLVSFMPSVSLGLPDTGRLHFGILLSSFFVELCIQFCCHCWCPGWRLCRLSARENRGLRAAMRGSGPPASHPLRQTAFWRPVLVSVWWQGRLSKREKRGEP